MLNSLSSKKLQGTLGFSKLPIRHCKLLSIPSVPIKWSSNIIGHHLNLCHYDRERIHSPELDPGDLSSLVHPANQTSANCSSAGRYNSSVQKLPSSGCIWTQSNIASNLSPDKWMKFTQLSSPSMPETAGHTSISKTLGRISKITMFWRSCMFGESICTGANGSVIIS